MCFQNSFRFGKLKMKRALISVVALMVKQRQKTTVFNLRKNTFNFVVMRFDFINYIFQL